MSSLRYTLSVSVANLLESLGTAPVSAGELLNQLLENHPEYGGGIAREVVPIAETSGDSVPVDGWIDRVARLFRFEESSELHGRLMVVGLAMMDERVRARLISTGLLQAVAGEVQEGVEALLTPEARKTWRIIESRWHDSGAISITPADPPSKAPERTQSRIPDPAPSPPPASAVGDLSQSAAPVSSAAPDIEEPPQSSAAEVSQT
ncbi:MAG TPA: hypothetical protein VFT45_11880, partial [Longimicrobium sp.]|nr:hypothetical protein [Longimicrobium sp.]